MASDPQVIDPASSTNGISRWARSESTPWASRMLGNPATTAQRAPSFLTQPAARAQKPQSGS